MSTETTLDIDYLAKLSRLELSEAEKSRFKSQLEHILEHFQALEQVDVSGVAPSAHAHDVCNVWDEDESVAGFEPEQALANAPSQRLQQISVPKVVDDA
jgi:aspartyl-tRNA(Asn)/glutamyl-tRNA(Gln) amidotransferase subunit C